NHELVPSIASSKDGKQLYIAWYTGGPGEGHGNYVTMAVSTNGGKNWKNDELVIYPKDTTARFFDPVLWTAPDDKIWLFYATATGKVKWSPKWQARWDLRGGVSAIPITWDGKSVKWQAPRLLSYGVMMNKPIYVSAIAKVLFPVSVWQLGLKTNKSPAYIPDGTFINSLSFKGGDKMSYLEAYSSIKTLPDSLRTFDEHQMVETDSKGGMMCLVRTKKGIYYAKSTDYGKSWTQLQPFDTIGKTTPSRFYIGKLNSGKLILVLNADLKRTNMTALLSSDGGKTWPNRLLLDNRKNVSYPDVAQDLTGNIHITYDRDRTGAKEINYCRITEQDIINGNEKGIFKIRVNN
ncbi:sialidase family protein, partial [Pedobacter sp.]